MYLQKVRLETRSPCFLRYENKRLRKLELVGASLGEEGGAALAAGLARNATLTYLDLGTNDLGHHRTANCPATYAILIALELLCFA